MKRIIRKSTAIVLALLIILSAAGSVFAQGRSGTAGLFVQGGTVRALQFVQESSDSSLGSSSSGNDAAGNVSENSVGKDAEANSTQNSAGNEASNTTNNNSSEMSETELKQRKDIYTIVALIALAAILVGIRDKRRRR